MALEPTLHRAYYRRRSQPRLTIPDALVANPSWDLTSGYAPGPCAAGSRWRRFALTTDDVGRTAIVGADGVLTVAGAARTDAPFANLSVGENATICDVKESVGGSVKAGPDCSDWTNPEISFAAAPGLAFTATSLQAVEKVPDVGILEVAPTNCAAPSLYADDGADVVFAKVGDVYYAHPRPRGDGDATSSRGSRPRRGVPRGNFRGRVDVAVERRRTAETVARAGTIDASLLQKTR